MRVAPWLVVICVVASAGPARAGQERPTSEGRLVTRAASKLVEVPLEHTDVQIRIDGLVAEATVTQRFRNSNPAKLEAVYLFPLPTGAAVSEMTITTGTRTIRGSIQERDKAKQIYEAARSKGFVAALLTQERPNLFTQSIANLEPASTVIVTLHYVQRLAYEDGAYSVVFPMVAGPRYLPRSAKDPAVQPEVLPPGLRSSHDISLAVELDAGVPIEGITSPSHQLVIERAPASANTARIRIASADTIPNKDFILRYQVAGSAAHFGVIAHRDGGTGSFVFLAQPPTTAQPKDIAPRELVFVLDTSSSMRGAPLVKAKELIRRALWNLRPDDTFQIVRFDDRASALGAAPIANKPNNIDLTLRWLAALEAGGTTEMITGVETALALPHDPLRVRIVAFITDGYVGNEDEILRSVGKHVNDTRLFTFGVGSAVNRYLLEEMAAIGRGAVQVVRPDEDTASAVASFGRRIDAPLLTDLRIEWGTLPVRDVVPQAIPDLFLGQPLALSGHYTGGGSGVITVRGRQAGREVSFQVAVSLPDHAARPAIATLWARERITELSRRILRKADPAIDREILGLALEHHLLTGSTAFVAVDDSRVTAGGAAKRVAVPVEVPDAVRNIQSNADTWGSGTYYSSNGIGYGTSSSTSLHAYHVAAVPTFVEPAIKVSGSLDASTIRRHIKRRIAQVTYCYEKALLSNHKLAGTVTATFVIMPASGLVSSSNVTGLGDKEVEACIAQVLKTIEFPKVENNDVPIRVNYPFVLHPAKEYQ